MIAVFLACFHEYRQYLAPGERGTVVIIAADRKQARTIFRYIRGLLTGVPMLKRMIERHAQLTGSALARRLLEKWSETAGRLVRVMPNDYRRMLDAQARMRAKGLSPDEAEMAAFEENAHDEARVSGN